MAHRAAGRLKWATFTPLFWVLAAMYLGHRLWAWLSFPRAFWVRHYLDDLLCLPLILTVSLFFMRALFGPAVRFTKYQVAFAVAFVALAFEIFFPLFLPRYTSDFWDVVLYAIGGYIFYRFLNR
ncbi:magnesium citrate secondary transporter [Rufibacter soli]